MCGARCAGLGTDMRLADIPFYGAYSERKRQNEQAPLAELQQASGAMSLMAAMEKAKREQQFRGDLEALGPNATQEQLAQVGAKYASAPDLLKSQTASLDRKASIQATAEAARARIAQAQQNAEMVHEFRMSRAATDADRLTETARHNKALEGIQAQNAQLTQHLRTMGIDIQRQGLDLRRDINAQKTEKVATEKEASVNNVSANMDRLAQEANRLLTHPGLAKTTGLRSWAPLVGGLATVPGTDAANFKASLETLKSQAGFSVLQAMRDASKTGGALGQVSDFENRMLQANLAALDTAQSEEEFKAALNKIIKYTEDAKGRLKAALGTSAPAAPAPAAPPAAGGKVLRFDAQGNPLP